MSVSQMLCWRKKKKSWFNTHANSSIHTTKRIYLLLPLIIAHTPAS
jgi:hypothetical protein